MLAHRHSLFFLTGIIVSLLSGTISNGGTITGIIRFNGNGPALYTELKGDKNCIAANGGSRVPSETVVVNGNHTLKNVFVYIKSGLEGKHFPVPAQSATMTQRGCRYIPHVMGMMVRQPLIISNDDPTLHNVHATPQYSAQFNLAEPNRGASQTRTFDKPEVMVRMKCDVHRWMSAFIGVLDHPFFSVSNENGEFTIPGVPPGTYEVEAWHEKYGTQLMKITVGPSESKRITFSYSAE
jgi:hypothetical protein